MKRLIAISFAFFTSVIAHAELPNTVEAGLNAGYALCQTYSFDSEVRQCADIVRRSEFLQTGAVDACSALSFFSDQMKCLTAVANKVYLSQEIQLCASRSFDSDKLSCFTTGGKDFKGYLKACTYLSTVVDDIRHAKRLLRQNDILGVNDMLTLMENELSRCL